MAAIVQSPRPYPSNRRSRLRHKAHVSAYATVGSTGSDELHDLCPVIDISERGLALQCAARVQIDQTVPLRVSLAEGGEINASARVAWFDSAGHVGFNLEPADDSGAGRLHEWLLFNTLAAAAGFKPVANLDSPAIPPRQNYTDLISAASAVQREAESLGADLEAVLSLIASRSKSLLRASAAAVALAGKDAQTMICRASIGECAPPLGASLRVGSGFSGECVGTGKPLRSDDTETDARVNRESCRSFGIRSALAVPVRAGQETIGLLEVFSAQPHTFDESDSAVLQRFAESISAALGRAIPDHTPAESPAQPKPFLPSGGVLFANLPEPRPKKASSSMEAPGNEDNVGGIRLPRFHLFLLIAVAGTIFLVLGFVSAPWIQPWVQERLHPSVRNGHQSVLAASKASIDTAAAPAPGTLVETANLPQLREIANHGDPAAENAMGLLYSAGDEKQGIGRNEEEAARWFTKAAEHGSVPAQSKLGSLFWGGRGVAKDDNKAYFWTVLARANGDDASKALAPFIASRLTLPQRAAIEQQAEQWLQQHESRAQAQPPR